MPGAQERVLRRRIASVTNTKKITRAMELIAATRVKKAQMAANEARPYSEDITTVIADLASGGVEVAHPLLRQVTDIKKVGVVCIAGDRGLAGAYNSTVIRAAEAEINAARNAGQGYTLITVGNKAEAYFKFRNYDIEASFGGMTDKPAYEDARAVADAVTTAFETDCDVIELVYTRFISIGKQEVVVRRFLPLETAGASDSNPEDHKSMSASFEFVPSPEAVLEAILPRYVESRLFSALLDAAASEHANRQQAMKAATDNAQDMILRLSRKMNQARQDTITTEISEIISGAEALSADKGSSNDLLLDFLNSDPFPRHVHNPDHS